MKSRYSFRMETIKRMLSISSAGVVMGLVLALASTAEAQDTATADQVVQFIGFQQLDDASRVYVRTDVTPNYRLERPDDQTIELVFNAADVAVERLLLPIDTRYFESPVLDITPIKIEGASQNTIRITIRLRAATQYFTSIKDSTVFLTVKR